MADTVRIEIAVEATDNTGKALSSIAKGFEDLAKASEKSRESLGRTSEQTTKYDEQAQKTQKTLQNWVKQKWQVALEAKDKISPVLSTVKGVLSNLAGRAWNITLKAFDFVTAPVRGILNILKNPVFQAGSILGVTIGLKDTIDTYKDFEAAMSQVQAVSGASGSELEKLTAKAKEMGATTKFTAKEAADAFNYMAMAGWKTGDMLNGIEGIMSLAAASGEDLATTSDIVTDALTAFGLTAADSGHFADILAAASSNANTNVSMMGETFKYAASIVGSLYGEGERAAKGMEDSALAVGLMANAGIKGTQAGTALRSILTRLSTDAGATSKSLGALGILTEKLGVQFYDESGAVRDLSTILTEARAAWAGLSAEQSTSYAKTIAGQYAMSGWLAIMNAAPADVEKLTEAIEHADGAAERMKDTMLDNLQGSFTLLQSALDGVKLSLGERLAPYFRNLAEGLTGAMPAIERAVTEFMDWFDGKVEQFKVRYREAISTDGFADMDLFGKIEILWDKIIAEPFSEWWNGGGKQMLANVSGDIGAGIGTGLKTGILMLLGIDVSDTTEQGVSIGKAFAEGFASGFDSDTVGKGLKSALGGLLSNAGEFLPGGEAPGLDSALSAYLLYKVASPALAVGKGAYTIGKSVFTPTAGSGESEGQSLASWVMGSATKQTGLLGIGSKAAAKLGIGDPLIGSSLSAGTSAAVGLGSIAGGLIGGFSLLNGVKDLYTGFTSEDAEKAVAYKKAGRREILGVGAGAGAGAALGATIGAGFFGIGAVPGALIGAGIGGIAGMMSGNKAKKEYEERAQAAQKAAEAEAAAHELIKAKTEYTGQSLQTVTFKSRELNEAFHDSEITVEKFGMMFREAVSEKVRNSFGDISLSLQEIKNLADSIVFDGMAGEAEKFQNALATSDKALASVKSDSTVLEKMNWQASLGFNFSSSDVSEYQTQVDNFVKDAQTYITDKHYEATVALRLITGGEGDTTGLDSAYASIKSELADKSAELQNAVQKALEDGVISTEPVTLPDGTIQLSEYEEITNLQNQISEIMNRVSAAEESAQLDALKIKYGGSNLDAASFQQLQAELAANVADMTATYDEALQISLTNLHLQLDQGAISEEDFQAQLDALKDSYQLQISDMNLRVESFQLDTIAEAFAADLDGILPGLTGDISERLKQAMDAALTVEPDPIQWTQEQISQWFGLNGLDAETQAAVGGLLQNVAETIPEAIKTHLQEGIGNADLSEAIESVDLDASGVTDAISSEVVEVVENADLSGVTEALDSGVADAMNSANLSGVAEALESGISEAVESADFAGLTEEFVSSVTEAAEAGDYTGVTEALDSGVMGAVENVEFSGTADALQSALGTEIGTALADTDMSEGTAALQEALTSGVTGAMENADFSAGGQVLKASLESDITEAISNPEISAAKEALRSVLGSGIAEAVNSVDLSAAYAALAALRQALESRAQSVLGAQITVDVPVSLTYNYNVTNPIPPKPTVTAQTVTAPVNAGGRASGGFTSGAELSWIGEDGPEAIIPLGMKRRDRGLELYRQVGEILGVAKNAEGGVYGGSVYSGTVYNHSVYGDSMYESGNAPVSISAADTSLTNQSTDTTVYHARNTQVAEAAYDTQINPAVAYHSVNNAVYGGSRYRGGDMYHSESGVFLSTPASDVYGAGTQVSSFTETSTAYDVRNSDNTENSFVYGGAGYIGGNVYGGESRALFSSPVVSVYNGGDRMMSTSDFSESKTAYHARNNPVTVSGTANYAVYGGSRYRGGDSYQAVEYNSFPPAANAYAGTWDTLESNLMDISMIYNAQNSQTAAYRSVNSVDNRHFNVGAAMYADGGFTSGAELSWIGEDGPEAIIPLGVKRRGRGLELYKQVGEILGVVKNAEGGVYGTMPDSLPAIQSPETNTRTAYDTRNSLTTVQNTRNISGNSYRTNAELISAPSVSAYNTRNSIIGGYSRTAFSGVYADIQSNTDATYSNSQIYHDNSYRADSAILSPGSAAAYDMSRAANEYNRTETTSRSAAYDVRNTQTAFSSLYNDVRSNASESGTAYDNRRYTDGGSYRADSTILSPRSAEAYNMSQSAIGYSYQAGANTETAYDTRNNITAVQNSLTSLYPETATYHVRNSPLSIFNSGDSFSRSALNNPTDIHNNTRSSAVSFNDMRRSGNASAYNVDSLFSLPEQTTAYNAQESPETPFDAGVNIYAEGTESGGMSADSGSLPISDESPATDSAQGGGTSGAVINGTPVTINVSLNPQFNIEGSGGKSEEEIVNIIRRHLKEITDEIGGDLAERLIPVFQNMPMKGAV